MRSPTIRLRVAAATLVAVAAAGCATTVTLPPLPECHPANPEAASAERARPSDLLDTTSPIPAAEPDVLEGHDAQGHSMTGEASSPAEGGSEPESMPHHHQEMAEPSTEPAQPDPAPPIDHPPTTQEMEESPSAAAFSCPVHPEAHSDAPGTCPVCGMPLEPMAPEHDPAEGTDDSGHRHPPGGRG